MTKRVSKKQREPKVLLGEGGPTEAGFHSIQDIFRCAKAYQYGKVRGIRKPLAATPDHFALGILFHAMRARWFSLCFDEGAKAWGKVQDAAREEVDNSKLPMSPDSVARAVSLMAAYIDHWRLRPKPSPVAAEYLLGPAPLEKGDPFFMFRTARLDDVSHYPEAGGKLCIGESKTASTSIGAVAQEYELHGQPLLQLVLWKMCPNGEARFGPVAGIMLDAAIKAYDGKDPKFGRVFVPVRDETLQWYVQSLKGYLRAAAAIEWDTEAPRNPMGCTYMAGRARIDCDFKPLCMHGKNSSGQYVLADGSSLRAHQPHSGKEKMPWE